MVVARGILVGRFQPFHLGHLSAVKDSATEVDELIIVIGSSQRSYEFRNPFTAGERIEMIRETLIAEKEIDEHRIMLIPVPDTDIHYLWTYQMDLLVPRYDRVYTNDPFTKYLFTERGINVVQPRLHMRKDLSATKVRHRMVTDRNWQSLVSHKTAEFIATIDGVKRIKSLFLQGDLNSRIHHK
ncbi:MAG TPA: nicotinamide-nucleotide adenylyltransferase [Nitrososphaeraceae archaeon]|jgi:nicotinamide-nucleotide adenylyltransferase|nr:nicotinamide-nucleotide adenylyltransferase [Nitrososphaeraceae archaeon]